MDETFKRKSSHPFTFISLLQTIFFPQTILFKVILVINLWHAVSSFNLDTRYPIIFEDPSSSPLRRSYFGYSVVMYTEQGSNNSWIMVGAPRANSTYYKHLGIKEPGVVYKCPCHPYEVCQPVMLDPTGNENVGGLSPSKYHDLKDGAWIGATMDVQQGPNGRLVTCGPRWIDQNSLEEYYQLGVCYWMEAESYMGSVEKLIPLMEKRRRTYAVPGYKNKNIYDLGVGEAGMSIHMPLIKGTEKKSQLLLGAPGILNWKGGIVLYEDGSKTFGGGHNKRAVSVNDFTRLYLPAIELSTKVKDFDYLGYQVSSGYFFNENQLLYAASSPRALNVLGKVIIFDLLDSRDRPRTHKGGETILKVHREFYGIQTGEYFGASIAVCDLNGDDLDDLIIGAPLYAREDIAGLGFEEGRVSILIFNNSVSKELFGSAAGGRFGYAISCLGDLDSDGFSEFAVGAPYEDDGRGVVYIYYGNEKGNPNKVVQRITARGTHEFLRGFGASIASHTADLDRNRCPDVAVGAFLSGHAVIYRGRPVLRWKIARPRANPESIPHNATYFNLESVCIHYLGKNAPNELDVWQFVEMDPTHERCHMKNKTTIEKIIHLKRGEIFCETLEVHMKPGVHDILHPVEINIWYQLKEEKEMGGLITEFETYPIEVKVTGVKGKDDFCKECPISRGLSRSEVLIPFEVECGKDKICHADLSVTGQLPQLQSSINDTDVSFVIGSYKTLMLKVSVYNKPSAEAAYRTSVYIILGYPARISRIPPACTELSGSPFHDMLSKGNDFTNSSSFSSSTAVHSINSRSMDSYSVWDARSISLRCDLDNPLRPFSEREIWVELDMTNAHDATSMVLAAFATTVSNEIDLHDNWWSKDLPLLFEADITIAGRTAVEQYTYFNESKDDSETKINFIHIYEVQKFGYSPLKKIDIELQIPVSIKVDGFKNPLNFLTIKEQEANQGGQPISCILKEENTNDNKASYDFINPTYQKVMSIQDTSEINRTTGNEGPSNRTLYINCSSTAVSRDQSIICRSINCVGGPLLNSLTVAKVLISMVIDVKTLQPIMGVRDIIVLETRGFVKVIEPAGLIQPELEKADHSRAITLFIGDIPKKEVESWVLALAIGGGIMILFFLAMALAKAGFFERKKKEELKALKRQTIIETTSDAFKPEEQEIES